MTEFTIDNKSLEAIKDAVVVITGACSGIGLATAELLLSLQAHVVGGDLQPPPQGSTLADNASFTYVRCDVTVWADQLALFDTAEQKHGRIDHVFANAGIATVVNNEYVTDVYSSEGVLQEPKHPVIAVNLIGAGNTLKAGVHYLRKNRLGGSLVATASTAAFFATPSLTEYCASKSGLLSLVRCLAMALGETDPDVRANTLTPSWTDTPILNIRSPNAKPLIETQPASAVAKAAVSCMVETSRHGETICIRSSRYFLLEAAYHQAVEGFLPRSIDKL